MMYLRLSLLIATLALIFPAFAADEIGWEDLEPEMPEGIEDPFVELTDDQLFALSMVARYREIAEQYGELSEAGQAEYDGEMEKLIDWGVDVDGLLEKRMEIIEQRMRLASETNPELNGASVKIPGYLLPLEFSDNLVTEFLLVPYVGACIHTPPPPPNQIVHVNSEFGVVSNDLYAPVWVEGVMKTESLSATLSFVDGTDDIPVAYQLEAQEVTPYE